MTAARRAGSTGTIVTKVKGDANRTMEIMLLPLTRSAQLLLCCRQMTTGGMMTMVLMSDLEARVLKSSITGHVSVRVVILGKI